MQQGACNARRRKKVKSAYGLCWRFIAVLSVSLHSSCSSSVLLWFSHSHLFHLWCSLGLPEAHTQTCPQSSSVCCQCGRSNVKIGTYSESWWSTSASLWFLVWRMQGQRAVTHCRNCCNSVSWGLPVNLKWLYSCYITKFSQNGGAY